MQKLLMFMYHLTPEQAAARVPVFQFWLTAFGAALLIWLDSKGVFDGLGAWFGRVLRDTAVGDLIRKFMRFRACPGCFSERKGDFNEIRKKFAGVGD